MVATLGVVVVRGVRSIGLAVLVTLWRWPVWKAAPLAAVIRVGERSSWTKRTMSSTVLDTSCAGDPCTTVACMPNGSSTASR